MLLCEGQKKSRIKTAIKLSQYPTQSSQKLQMIGTRYRSHTQAYQSPKSVQNFRFTDSIIYQKQKHRLSDVDIIINILKNKNQYKTQRQQSKNLSNNLQMVCVNLQNRSISSRQAHIKEKRQKQLYKCLFKKPFFSKINGMLMHEICQKIEYVEIKAQHYLYKKGDLVNGVYVILDGQVEIIDNDKNISISNWESFGEYKFAQKVKRLTDAKAKINSKLLLINKEVYDEVQKSNQKEQSRKIFKFISLLGVFDKIYRPILEKMISQMQTLELVYGQKLYCQAQNRQNIYILAEGELTMLKRVQTNSYQQYADSHLNNNKGWIVPANKAHFSPNKTHYSLSKTQSKANDLQMETQTLKNVAYRKVQRGQILGDAQAICNIQQHTDSCVASSQKAVVFSFTVNQYLSKIFANESEAATVKEYARKKVAFNQGKIDKFLMKHYNDSMFLKYLPKKNSQFNSTQRKVIMGKKSKSIDLGFQQKQKHKSISQNEVDISAKRTPFVQAGNLVKSQSVPLEFFKQFNSTFKNSDFRLKNKRKISKTITLPADIQSITSLSQEKFMQKQRKIPATIEDIVKIVKIKQRYEKRRRKGGVRQNSFQLNLKDVPLFVQKKYPGFFNYMKDKK